MKNKIIITGLLAFVIIGGAAMAITQQGQLFQGMLSLNKLSSVAQDSQSLAKVKRIVTTTAKKEDLLKIIDEMSALEKAKKYDEIVSRLTANEQNLFANLMLMNPPDETMGSTFGSSALNNEINSKKEQNLSKIASFSMVSHDLPVLDFWQNNYNAYIVLDEPLVSQLKYKAAICYSFEKRNKLTLRKMASILYSTEKIDKETLAELKQDCETNFPLVKKMDTKTTLVPVQYSVGAKRAYEVFINDQLVDLGNYLGSYSHKRLPLVKGKNTITVKLKKKSNFKNEFMDAMLQSDFNLTIEKDNKKLITINNQKSDQDVEITKTFTY